MSRSWLVKHRESKEMTHDQVAKEVGITRQYYGMIESGDRDPRVEVAKKIANVLGFKWTLFFTQNGNEVLPDLNSSGLEEAI